MLFMQDINNVPNNQLRLQLLLHITKQNFDSINKKIAILKKKNIVSPSSKIEDDIKNIIGKFIDLFWVPVIVEEIDLANQKIKSYRDFFKNTLLWNQNLNYLQTKYPQELFFLTNLIKQEKKNFLLFLNRLEKDYTEITNFMDIKFPLTSILGNLSDRHQNGSVLELNFYNKKLIYKPKNAITDLFVTQYINTISTENESSYFLPKVLNKNDYSWHQFIKYINCKKAKDLNTFYYNYGKLLAILDSLNYTDGHNENFICSAPYLYLIDSETILTNLSYYENKINFFYNLEFTGMIKKIRPNEYSTTALQYNSEIAYMPAFPFIKHDCTKNIQIHYKTLHFKKPPKCYPKVKKIDIQLYLQQIQKGMFETYTQIAKNKNKLIHIYNTYRNILKPRQIQRHTIYYYWLLFKLHHPRNKQKESFLQKNLTTYNPYICTYEKEMLQKGNIPIFFQKPKFNNLYSLQKKISPKFYSHTAEYWFKKKLSDIDNLSFINQRLNDIKNLIKLSCSTPTNTD